MGTEMTESRKSQVYEKLKKTGAGKTGTLTTLNIFRRWKRECALGEKHRYPRRVVRSGYRAVARFGLNKLIHATIVLRVCT